MFKTWFKSNIDKEQTANSKKMKHVIGIAGGLEKLEAIRGAISGGIIHSLITDETSAQKLI